MGAWLIDFDPKTWHNGDCDFMQKHIYKTLFVLLKAIIYLKRAVIWLFNALFDGLSAFFGALFGFIGLRLFKFRLIAKKIAGHLNIPWDSKIMEIIGSRTLLQTGLLIIILFITIPQSKIYQVDAAQIPGHQTLLYQLVGPGEQDFSFEEVAAESQPTFTPPIDSWKQGAVVVAPSAISGQATININQEISGLSAGGTAVNKPIIMPGAALPTSGGLARSDVIYHEVKAGETIGAIAEQYGISLATILWSNNLTARSYIRPGDKLKILPSSGVVHKVRKGDTISKIAKLYNTTPEKIIKSNKLKEDGTDMVIGEELLVPDGRMPAPVYVAPVRRYTQLSNIAAPPPSVSAPAGSGYLWPTAARRITQYFGWRHAGVDIGGPVGTAIYATRSGAVTRSQCGWNGGYGCYIIIDHGNGVTTLYGHEAKLYVSVGEEVAQGQTIGLMGSTGRSTGPHVHFEVRVNGVRQNPLRYIR